MSSIYDDKLIECEECQGTGQVTDCCNSTYHEVNHGDEGWTICDSCNFIEPDLCQCSNACDDGYISKEEIIHNRECDKADNQIKSKKEES